MSEIAYIDESRRRPRYLLAAALIDHQAVATVRQAVRTLAPRGGSTRRHFVRESDASRRKCLAAYRALDGVTVLIYEHRGHGQPPVHQRAECLELMASELLGRSIDRLILDHVDDAQRRRDRQLLGRRLDGTGISYSHEPAHSTEALLWLPDAAAWCAGRPEWRQQLHDWATIRRV